MATTKTTFKRIVCVLSCCLVVVFSFAFPSSAQSVDDVFYFNSPDPSTHFDGYVVVPFYYSSTNKNAELIFWTIDCINDSSAELDPTLNVNLDVSKNKLTLSFENAFGTDANTLVYAVTIYTLWAGNNNPTQRTYLELVDYNSPYTYTINFPTSSYPNGYFLTPYHFKDVAINSSTNTGAFTYDCIYSNSNTQLNQLIEVNENFVSMLQKQDLTNEQFASLLEEFQFLLDSTYNIEYMFDTFLYYYWDEFANIHLPNNAYDIYSRLDKIYKLLNKSGDTEQTTVDSSHVDNYLDIEQSLVNNDEAESALNDFDISIEGASYSFIWDFITNIFNSHPEVFGLVITILTLGIIALLLNR